jgi:hypothetical protein
MSRGRVLAVSSVILALAGVVAALAVRSDGPVRPSLPQQAAALPAEATFIMGVDVPRFMASPFYRQLGGGPMPARREAWQQLQRWTGLDPERDLTQMIVAGSGSGRDAAGLALILGRFARKTVETTLAAAGGPTSQEHGGLRIWTLPTSGGAADKPACLALVEDGVAIAGPAADVEAAIDRRAAKTPGLSPEGRLAGLMQRLEPGATFWMVGDQGLVSAVSGAGAAGGWTIPSIRTLVVSGFLDPDVRATILADTPDAAEAKKVADMLRGLMGLAAMQAARRPEIQDLTSGVDIGQQDAVVKIGVRVGYDTLAKLQATPRPSPTSPPRLTPRPRAR